MLDDPERENLEPGARPNGLGLKVEKALVAGVAGVAATGADAVFDGKCAMMGELVRFWLDATWAKPEAVV